MNFFNILYNEFEMWKLNLCHMKNYCKKTLLSNYFTILLKFYY